MADRRCEDVPVRRTAVKVLYLASHRTDSAIDRQLQHTEIEQAVPPKGYGPTYRQAPLLYQHGDLPKADGTDSQQIVPQRFVSETPRFASQLRIALVEPDENMGIEQDQRSASHSTSTGEMISPLISISPL